jgi:hypothetical protein
LKSGFHTALSVTHTSHASNRDTLLKSLKPRKRKRKSNTTVELTLRSALAFVLGEGGLEGAITSGESGADGAQASHPFKRSSIPEIYYTQGLRVDFV